jgi:hypothetical protein
MKLIRTPAFLAAAAMSMILLLYFGLVANRAFLLLATEDPLATGLGIALLVFPAIGVWWMVHEWRLGTAVQRMANVLEQEGRLPLHDGETLPSGRLTEDAAEAVFEVARRAVEDQPDDWRAWFHVAYAYEAVRERSQARQSLRHAADLFRRDRSTRSGIA